MQFEVHTFTGGPLGTHCHVVIDPNSKKSWIVDAPYQILPQLVALQEARQLHYEALILTHSHWDHIADAASLKKKWHLPVWIHQADAHQLEHPGSDGVFSPFSIEGVSPTRHLEEGETLSLEERSWKVLHTPGHTPGSIVLYCPEESLMLTGDTLFKGTYGRTDLSTGDSIAMRQSLEKLRKLPGTTRFYPGHGPESSLDQETWLLHL